MYRAGLHGDERSGITGMDSRLCLPGQEWKIPGWGGGGGGREQWPKSKGTRVMFNNVSYAETMPETSPLPVSQQVFSPSQTSVPIREIAWRSRPGSTVKPSFISLFPLQHHPLQPLHYFHTLGRLPRYPFLNKTAWASAYSPHPMTIQKANLKRGFQSPPCIWEGQCGGERL